MTQYVIVYLGGNPPSSPEEGQQQREKYMQWIGSLGAAAISPMNPMMNTKTVNADGSVTDGGSMAMSGYTIVDVDNFDAALSMAKECPFLEIGGSLEVSELMQMPG